MSTPVLIYPHVPKTGGTTLFHHFRTHFGEGRVLTLGPHSRVHRFFNALPQFEEMTEAERSALKVTQGHGVGQNVIEALGPRGQGSR